jgi:ribosomal protein S18 acetylase RimI-like enzyme
MLEIKTLESTTIEQITEAFNVAFTNYFFPIKFSEAQFEEKFATEGGRLDLSVGVFENEKLVAFILHFVDLKNGEKYIYNGGTGVIEAFRGNQLTSKMYDFISPILKVAKVDKMILEVLTQNTAALKIYETQGFKIKREVYCFGGQLNGRIHNQLTNEFNIVTLKTINWALLQTFWDYPPTWQNSITTMNNIQEQISFIGIKKDNQLVGYVIYNPKFRRIHQMAIAKTHRNIGLGSRLLNHIYQLEKEKISFINVDSRTKGLKVFLEKRGFINHTNQYEMEINLV